VQNMEEEASVATEMEEKGDSVKSIASSLDEQVSGLKSQLGF
jgi:hypothetical protein